MARDVISHRRPRRKRGSWRGYIARRFGALVVTIAALAAGSWLAPTLRTTSVEPPLPTIAAAPPSPALATEPVRLLEADVTLDLAGPPAPPRRTRVARGARGIPLDAAAEAGGESYEILSAAELAAISQARD